MSIRRRLAWFPLRALRYLDRCYRAALDSLQKDEDERYEKNTIGANTYVAQSVLLMGNNSIAPGTLITGHVVIGEYSTIGANSTIHGAVRVGRYCQFGPHVAIYSGNHSISYLTTYNGKKLFDGRLKDLVEAEPVDIGHDVWIGHGAIVLPGVRIGNGAVIGAGSIVTSDVASYSVAVGGPAREIHKRFDPRIISLLTRWQWWNLGPEELGAYEDVFRISARENPDLLVARLEAILRSS